MAFVYCYLEKFEIISSLGPGAFIEGSTVQLTPYFSALK